MPAPFTPQTFAAARAERPDLHPASAIMAKLGTNRPQFTEAELIRQRESELAFWPAECATIRANITRRYACKIAAAACHRPAVQKPRRAA